MRFLLPAGLAGGFGQETSAPYAPSRRDSPPVTMLTVRAAHERSQHGWPAVSPASRLCGMGSPVSPERRVRRCSLAGVLKLAAFPAVVTVSKSRKCRTHSATLGAHHTDGVARVGTHPKKTRAERTLRREAIKATVPYRYSRLTRGSGQTSYSLRQNVSGEATVPSTENVSEGAGAGRGANDG